ncbi:hypothetical protein [Streptomyces sp. NPDC002671]
MFPKCKVTRNWRQDKGTPSRHPRLGARAAALIVLGSGMVGLWSAPMAHAAGHDSIKIYRSSGTFTGPEHGADGGDDGIGTFADDPADFKDDADVDSADDLADFVDDVLFQITVIVNNNNNNNNGGGNNNNNNNN